MEKSMSDIVFSSKNGSCPRYKNYFIHDHYDGHIDGRDMYSYALFKDGQIERKRFKTFKEADDYIKSIVGVSPYYDDWIQADDYNPGTNDERLKAAIIGGIIYRIWKDTNTVEIKQPDIQITSFYPKYRDCLEDAKKIVAEEEKQFSIFDYYVPDPEEHNTSSRKRR